METDGRLRGDAGPFPFLNFLRGMETDQRPGRSCAVLSFLNFLRGMETDAPYKTRDLGRLLPKLP